MKVTKAVIPAAGLGTRVLPATKAMPKEMLTIVDKPAIQYIVEEAVNAGITDILIITNRGKGLMEDHFDRSPELEQILEKGGKTDFLEVVKGISELANISFIRQKEMKGLGHAVLKAKSFVGNEPFAVLFGDGVIISKKPAIRQLIDCYGEYGEGVVGVKKVPAEDIHKYGSLKVENLHDNVFKCTDMKEKPKTLEEAFSLYSILDRCVLPPEIFEILENTKPAEVAVEKVGITFNNNDEAVRRFLQWVLENGTKYNHQYGLLNLDQKVAEAQTDKVQSKLTAQK